MENYVNNFVVNLLDIPIPQVIQSNPIPKLESIFELTLLVAATCIENF
jgi:hypothetical protein